MNKKRPAPTASSNLSKKRRTDGLPKYYAVRAGFKPGVYLDYSDCQQQTAGFKGAVFKSFTSRDDAEAFVAGKKVAADAGEPAKFYAVAVGSPTGIYTDWNDAAAAIKGVKGPKYKRFATRAEAVAYIKQFGNREAVEALAEMGYAVDSDDDDDDSDDDDGDDPLELSGGKNRAAAAAAASSEDVLKIWTDGSSLANGKVGSRAGVGVFFGDGDARNVSERLEGELQTNQRAELMAMVRALQIAPRAQTVQIVSDSQYSINCVTQWAVGWKLKDWMTATGEKVKNQDLIRAVLDKIDERTLAGANTYFHWVKGHSADRGNRAADRLAVRGAKIGFG
ncbi:hypothetical protein CDD80_1166 [Ophiocordyceps camponoti-rufipedis]|uniref:Ribonuclease H n=1 Tax=Ophiocordyceps camponoti-rufipedis TaxID=2004952 RepID=A0A2C5Y8N0_9HYPO|nr:hypothetical protein CDD80_1166 [Ophiocordyceps camponoti-rufipedis]